ncbi:MAG TPA: hypothetical protein VF169_05020 [Albitalea sp.]|uniref:hypothetical protein n=1 Tax=Piscinibacter sp. TaxID=1903157 RepID=UPI002ED517BB
MNAIERATRTAARVRLAMVPSRPSMRRPTALPNLIPTTTWQRGLQRLLRMLGGG